MPWRTLRVACVSGVVIAAVASACGGSSSSPAPNSAGSAGSSAGSSGRTAGTAGTAGKNAMTAGAAGMSSPPPPLACGKESCTAVVIPIMGFTIPPCCADAATNHCGLDSSVLASLGVTFVDTCQPLAQPGSLDVLCPDSPQAPVQGTQLTISFPGCCRPNHTCGYDLDKVAGIFPVGLGCVDSTPFLNGASPTSCGDSAGAAGSAAEAGSSGESAGGSPAGGTAGVIGSGTGGAPTGGVAGGGTGGAPAGGVAGGAAGGLQEGVPLGGAPEGGTGGTPAGGVAGG